MQWRGGGDGDGDGWCARLCKGKNNESKNENKKVGEWSWFRVSFEKPIYIVVTCYGDSASAA